MANSGEEKTNNLGNKYKITFGNIYESEKGIEFPPENARVYEGLQDKILNDECISIPASENTVEIDEKGNKVRRDRAGNLLTGKDNREQTSIGE